LQFCVAPPDLLLWHDEGVAPSKSLRSFIECPADGFVLKRRVAGAFDEA
jgi:hypothetical protein